MKQPHDDITLTKGDNILNVGLNPVAIPLAGELLPGLIWHEPLTAWEPIYITPPKAVPLNKEIYIAPGWVNKSEIAIVGHVKLTVTYPGGIEKELTATQNQDRVAQPNNGYHVLFEPFICSVEGTYALTAILSSSGQVLDVLSYTVIASSAEIVGLHILGVTAERRSDKGITVNVKWLWNKLNWGETGDFAVAGAYFGEANTDTWGLYRETFYHNPPEGVPLEQTISFPWDFLTGMGEHPEEAYKYHDFKIMVQLFRQYWNPTPWSVTYIAKGVI